MSSVEPQESNPLNPPQLPPVTRLNRNVLLVAGMGVGVVILAVMHMVRGKDPTPGSRAGPPVEVGAMASFLKQPPLASNSGVPIPPPADAELIHDIQASQANTAVTLSRVPSSNAYAAGAYDMYSIPSVDPRKQPTDESYRRALRAGLRANNEGSSSRRGKDDVDQSIGPGANPYAAVDHQIPVAPLGMPVDAVARGLEASLKASSPRTADRHQEFMAAAAENQSPTYIASRVQDLISPYQIMAGTLLPAMLVTGINSDLPGDILAQITRNVYDSQQRFLLIPRGTKLIGRYDSQVALGQSRMLIAWTRLILPDGRSISLPGLPTKDLRGTAGLRDEVNNHYGRLFGQAALLSIVGAGAQLSQPRQASVLTPASAGQLAAGALGQELSAVSMETIRRNMDIRPTLQLRPGTPFYIFLERDLVLEGVYADAR